MSRCAQSRSVNLAARRASQRRMRSRLRSATCSPVAACRQHARSRHACCGMRVRAMCIPASHACIGRARRHHDTRRLARQAPRIAHVERAGRLPRLDPTRSGSIRLESNRLESSLPRTLPDRAVHRFRTPPCTQAPPRRASPRPPQSTRIETAAIRGRTRRRDAPEMPAQRLLGAEPRERGNACDGQRGIALDHLLREPDPLADQPFV